MMSLSPFSLPSDFVGTPIPAIQKVRVACYIRVSTDNPEQEDSFEV